MRRRADSLTALGSDPSMALLRLQALDVLLVDRASPGYELPAKQGVGLARRIGADLALALWQKERLLASGFGCTDADVTLPDDYFRAGEAASADCAAVVFPFVHVPSNDAAVDRATELYECSLRYYVLGLAHARSPYAYHTVGSTLYLSARAYAEARGFPRRLAGEDFHLLGKLAKLGPIGRLRAPAIRIAARRSWRVPFGTGPAIDRLIAAGELALYAPECFSVLRAWLGELRALCNHGDLGQMQVKVSGMGEPLLPYLESLSYESGLRGALRGATSPAERHRRVHTWFDAKKTLRLVHAARDAGFGMVPWREALRRAPFVPGASTSSEALGALRASESKLEMRTGP